MENNDPMTDLIHYLRLVGMKLDDQLFGINLTYGNLHILSPNSRQQNYFEFLYFDFEDLLS